MTLDKAKFLAGMTALSGAFGREIDGPIHRVYYSVLNAKMNDEQFELAINRVLSENTFWPSPADILGKLNADDSTQGELAFEHVNRVMGQHGGPRFLPHAVFLEEFDAPTRAAIAAVGGLSEIADTSPNAWGGLRRRFAKAHADAKQPRLARPRTDAKVERLVADTSRTMGLSRRDRAAGERE